MFQWKPLIGLICVFSPLLFPVAVYAADGERVTIEVGTTSVPPYASTWFQNQIESFQKAHPNIEVKTFALGDPQRPLVTLEDVPKLAENVIGLQVPYEDELSYLLSRDLLVPVDAFLPDADFSYDQFYDSMWSPVRREDIIWGVPWNMTAHWLVCYWPLFEQEGIAEPPKTWEEFIDTARRLTKDTDGNGEVDQWGIRFDLGIGTAQLLWLTLDRQNGVKYEQNGRFVFDQPQIKKDMEFLKELCTASYTKMDSASQIAPPDFSKYGMFFVHSFLRYLPRIPDQIREVYANRDFRFVEVPTSNRRADLMGPQLYLAVRRSTPERENASWEFVKWINRPDADIPPIWLGFPVRKDFLARPDVRAWGEKINPGWDVPFRSMERAESPAYGAHGAQLITTLGFVTRYLEDESTLPQTIENLSKGTFFIPTPTMTRSHELLK